MHRHTIQRIAPLVLLLLVGTLTVPAVGAWEEFTEAPAPVAVEPGAGLVFAAGAIWGIFPVPAIPPEDPNAYLYRFDCSTLEWEEEPHLEMEDRLEFSAITWQPGLSGSGVIWFVGNLAYEPALFSYDIDEEEGDDEDIEGMYFGPGVALAHGDAWYPSWVKEIELNVGWLYCLEGGSDEFWRYGIPHEVEPPEEDSIYPPDSSALADPTPPFEWSAPDSSYRLLVATDENFNNVVIDQTTSTSNYEPTSALGDDQYFWRVGTSDGLGGYSWSQVYIFWLGVGWVQLEDLPATANYGAALAYDHKDYYGKQAPIAFRGGAAVDAYYIYEFDDVASQWTINGEDTPYGQRHGTAWATPPSDADEMQPFAVFGQVENEEAYYHHTHFDWVADGGVLLATPHGGASLAYAHHDDQDYLYMIHGNSLTTFGRLAIADEDMGVGEPPTARPLVPHARLVAHAGEQTLRYTLEAPGPVRVTLCDVSGRVAAILQSGPQPAGEHELRWSPRSLGLRPGVYVVALDAAARHERLKVTVR